MRPIVADSPSGVVLLNKQPGLTSFQALFPIKRVYGTSVGHTGTLDKFAEGLLVVLVGKFTKFNPLFTAFDKVYEADFTFGHETSTLDPEGEVIYSGPPPDDSVLSFAGAWVGALMQVPPDYSAIHVAGQRASDRIRDGQSIVLPARAVTVYELTVLNWSNPVLTVRIHCSKGTYIRSIARDWGRASGFGAHVTRLRRLSVGPFTLPGAPAYEFKDDQWVLERLGIPRIHIPADCVSSILNGRDPLAYVPALGSVVEDKAGLVTTQDRLIAVVEKQGQRWSYLFVDRGDPR